MLHSTYIACLVRSFLRISKNIPVYCLDLVTTASFPIHRPITIDPIDSVTRYTADAPNDNINVYSDDNLNSDTLTPPNSVILIF